MSDVALLNPQIEVDGMKRLIDLARAKHQEESNKLLTVELDHTDYLKTFGAVSALGLLLVNMEETYQRTINK